MGCSEIRHGVPAILGTFPKLGRLSRSKGLQFEVVELQNAAMKRFSLLLAAIAFFSASCERHEFEGENGTKQLHAHGKGHGDDHAKDKDHGEDKDH